MQPAIRKVLAATIALVAAGALAGCGNLSHGIARDGTHAQQLVWPEPARTNALHRGGTFPNLDNLRQVKPGLDKRQIMALIGSPHFGAGFGAREWTYLFNFHKDGAATQCEFKLLFDHHKVARSIYWHPESCADVLDPPAPKTAPEPQPQTFTLSTDALFAFDKYRLADITRTGVKDLGVLAGKLTAPGVHADNVEVIGYTDRLGSDAYNMKLSTERANTVRDFLVEKGVAPGRITAEGRGKADPVKTCDPMPQAKLIECLAPNRRVVVKVEARH